MHTVYIKDCLAFAAAHANITYANDDSTIGFLKSENSSMKGFQRETQGVVQWHSDHSPEVNVTKTKGMVIDFD